MQSSLETICGPTLEFRSSLGSSLGNICLREFPDPWDEGAPNSKMPTTRLEILKLMDKLQTNMPSVTSMGLSVLAKVAWHEVSEHTLVTSHRASLFRMLPMLFGTEADVLSVMTKEVGDLLGACQDLFGSCYFEVRGALQGRIAQLGSKRMAGFVPKGFSAVLNMMMSQSDVIRDFAKLLSPSVPHDSTDLLYLNDVAERFANTLSHTWLATRSSLGDSTAGEAEFALPSLVLEVAEWNPIYAHRHGMYDIRAGSERRSVWSCSESEPFGPSLVISLSNAVWSIDPVRPRIAEFQAKLL